MYSLQDLEDVATDVLLPELAKIHASFAQHIKTDCQVIILSCGLSAMSAFSNSNFNL